MQSLIREQLLEAQSTLATFMADDQQLAAMQTAIGVLASCLGKGGKVLSCGNGGSMCDAMHFAEELTGRFRNDRPAYAAIALSDVGHLTCAANDFGYDQAFARAISALGRPGDVLLAISTSGNSPNMVAAATRARAQGMLVVGLTGKGGGQLAPLCNVEVRVPPTPYADRVQEIHIKVIHCFIAGIERAMGVA